MGNAIILLGSITWAIRAQKLLERCGIRSYMKKIAGTGKEKSCGYGLEIRGDVYEAVNYLKSADIHIMEIVGG